MSQSEVSRQGVAALHLQGISLLVPLREVHTLESVLDLDPDRRSGRSIGAVRSADAWLAVYCLSDRLEPLATLASGFRICAVLASGAAAVAIACRSVETLDQTALAEAPLPECMRTADSPILGLAHHGATGDTAHRIYCRTSAAGLVGFLEPAA